jgi:hypothetical protein
MSSVQSFARAIKSDILMKMSSYLRFLALTFLMNLAACSGQTHSVIEGVANVEISGAEYSFTPSNADGLVSHCIIYDGSTLIGISKLGQDDSVQTLEIELPQEGPAVVELETQEDVFVGDCHNETVVDGQAIHVHISKCPLLGTPPFTAEVLSIDLSLEDCSSN